ncbi:MAG TPA: TfoX/Sxy family protein [Polyangia bacterium]|nr:TfoX/Sxy family protein [Polyangia bacterium]
MAWIKVPPENHPIFLAALPDDPRVETRPMFGGIAAKVNGHFFAGLFGLSAIVELPEKERAEALALEGAGPFDPMGDGRARSHKVMLPERFMRSPKELRRWLSRSFKLAAALPPKNEKPKAKAKSKAKPAARRKS